MSWTDILILGTANFISVFFAVVTINAVREYKETKKKQEFLEKMFGQLIEKAETDVQFRNIMGWNFMKDGRDNND